jgi:membrane associated rhomboid family serine protease
MNRRPLVGSGGCFTSDAAIAEYVGGRFRRVAARLKVVDHSSTGHGAPGINRNCHALYVKERVREHYTAQLDGLRALGVLVAIMWAVELVNALDGYRLDRDGIVPRNLSHLDGIVFAPFLHASFSHLLGNTVPLVILGFAIALTGARRLLLVSLIVALVSGLGVWLTSPGGTVTVGASGVVFGYATYLISRGLFDRRIGEVALGVTVVLLFGGALISDLIPRSGVSWEAHFFGGIGGVLAAAALARRGRGPSASGAAGLATSPR